MPGRAVAINLHEQQTLRDDAAFAALGHHSTERRPSIQREDKLTMETQLEQIAVKTVNQLPKSVVREIRTPRSVGACSEASCHSSG